MERTPKIERERLGELDAVRLLTVVHQLGELPAEPPSERRWLIDTESRLRHLDHLVRHPIDLAYVLMDQVRGRGVELESRLAELARQARRLLQAPRRRRRRPHLLRPFDAGSWRRFDDALAVAGCRGLLRVEPLPTGRDEGAGDLRYRLTAAGARWLRESIYPRRNHGYRDRCQLLRDVLPAEALHPGPSTALADYLHGVRRRLDELSRDERIRPEDDLLGHLFHGTFAEAL